MFASTVRAPAFWALLLALFPAGVRAETALHVPTGEPISITSDVMTVKNKENKAVFENNVVIKKGDLLMTADRVEVFLNGESLSARQGQASESVISGNRINEGIVSRLIATGHVKFQHGTKHAESREAVYEQAEDKIVLQGDPVLYEKEYRVTGTKMTFFLKENKSTIEESRVQFQPETGDHP